MSDDLEDESARASIEDLGAGGQRDGVPGNEPVQGRAIRVRGGNDMALCVFDSGSGKILHVVPDIFSKEISGVCVHPIRAGHMCVWGMDKRVFLLKP